METEKRRIHLSELKKSGCLSCVMLSKPLLFMPGIGCCTFEEWTASRYVFCGGCGCLIRNTEGPEVSVFELEIIRDELSCPHDCGEYYHTYPDRCIRCERLIG